MKTENDLETLTWSHHEFLYALMPSVKKLCENKETNVFNETELKIINSMRGICQDLLDRNFGIHSSSAQNTIELLNVLNDRHNKELQTLKSQQND